MGICKSTNKNFNLNGYNPGRKILTSNGKNNEYCCIICWNIFSKILNRIFDCDHFICNQCNHLTNINKCPICSDQKLEGTEKSDNKITDKNEDNKEFSMLVTNELKCNNGHILIWNSEKENCSTCKNVDIGLICELCSYSLCLSNCLKSKIHYNKINCLLNHPLTWISKKNMKCVQCQISINKGFSCNKCTTFYQCVKCSEFVPTTLICPNNHLLEWSLEKKKCSFCDNILCGRKCRICKYYVCDKCKEISEDSKFIGKKKIITLEGHTNPVLSIIKIDEHTIASGSQDKTIKLWDISTKICIKTLEGHNNSVSCIILLNDNQIVSGSEDTTIKIWDLSLGECINNLEGHYNKILSLIKLKNNIIASGSEDKLIKVWDIFNEVCIKTIHAHSDQVTSLLKFDDTYIASGSFDEIKIWNMDSEICEKVLKGHSNYVYCLVKFNDKEIISGSGYGTIKIWDIFSEECIKTFHGHTNILRSLIKLNEHEIASASWDKSIKIWNVSNKKCVQTVHLEWSPANCMCQIINNEIAIANEDKTIRILRIDNY